MKDGEFAIIEARIEALRAKWVEPLGLGAWTLSIVCYRDSGEYQEITGCGPASAALCDASWQYQDARISFNCPKWLLMSENEQERVMLHELCHLLLAELDMCMKFEDHHHIEHVTTTLAQAFWWVQRQRESPSL